MSQRYHLCIHVHDDGIDYCCHIGAGGAGLDVHLVNGDEIDEAVLTQALTDMVPLVVEKWREDRAERLKRRHALNPAPARLQ